MFFYCHGRNKNSGFLRVCWIWIVIFVYVILCLLYIDKDILFEDVLIKKISQTNFDFIKLFFSRTKQELILTSFLRIFKRVSKPKVTSLLWKISYTNLSKQWSQTCSSIRFWFFFLFFFFWCFGRSTCSSRCGSNRSVS